MFKILGWFVLLMYILWDISSGWEFQLQIRLLKHHIEALSEWQDLYHRQTLEQHEVMIENYKLAQQSINELSDQIQMDNKTKAKSQPAPKSNNKASHKGYNDDDIVRSVKDEL